MENMEIKKEATGAEKISISQDYEIIDWSKKFGITPDKLKRAVIEVGTNMRMLEQFLHRSLSN